MKWNQVMKQENKPRNETREWCGINQIMKWNETKEDPKKWTEMKPNNEMEWNQGMNPGNEPNKWTEMKPRNEPREWTQ